MEKKKLVKNILFLTRSLVLFILLHKDVDILRNKSQAVMENNEMCHALTTTAEGLQGCILFTVLITLHLT